jgi:hypothetical protein
MAVCRYHPDRPGIGVCMRCRVVLCADCSTRVDGVNHCHSCLKALGRRPASRPTGAALGALAALVVLSTAWLFFAGFFWLLQGRLAP